MNTKNQAFEFLQKLEEVGTKFYELNEKYKLEENTHFRNYDTRSTEQCFGLTRKASNDPAKSYSRYSHREYAELVIAIKHEGVTSHSWYQATIDKFKELSNEEIVDEIAWLKQTYDELEALYPDNVSYLKTLDVILGFDEEYYESSRCW